MTAMEPEDNKAEQEFILARGDERMGSYSLSSIRALGEAGHLDDLVVVWSETHQEWIGWRQLLAEEDAPDS